MMARLVPYSRTLRRDPSDLLHTPHTSGRVCVEGRYTRPCVCYSFRVCVRSHTLEETQSEITWADSH